MAVDFSAINIIDVIAQELFGGNTTISGLVIMLAVTFVMMAILANIKAPAHYALVPMIILSIVFAAMGVLNYTVSFIIIIFSAVLIALAARRTGEG